MRTNNVLIAAVGGQGAVLAARIISHWACEEGLDVKVSEVHGMSQRGGAVVTHVRYGSKVHSPVVEAGSADVVIGLEVLEGARYASMLRQDGVLIVNTQQIRPSPLSAGAPAYPSDLVERLEGLPVRALAIDALAEARAAGSVRAVNAVLLGAFARETKTEVGAWRRAITACVREAHRPENLAAFERGYAIAPAVDSDR